MDDPFESGSVVKHRLKREDELLDAAASVFYEHGYAGGSLQMVAHELGIKKGSIYHYITTKEDLLYRLLARLQREADEILGQVACLEGLDPQQRLALYVQRLVEFGVEKLPLVSVYCNDLDSLGEERRDDLYARRSVHERFVTDLIVQGQEESGIDATVDASLLSRCLFGTFMWTFKCHHPGEVLLGKELAGACSRFVLSGLVGCGAGSRSGAIPSV